MTNPDQSTGFTPHPIPDGIVEIHGKPYMGDGAGGFQPLETIKAQDKLEDEIVRKVMGFAIALSAQVSRFRGHTFTDLGEFDALLAQEYGVTKGGRKGNRTYRTVDGLYYVRVRVARLLDFGSSLQDAKALVDECLNEWSAEARPELRALVTRAFNTDQEGNINRSEIFTLLRLEIEDERWQSAMRAVRDAMRVVGSKAYLEFKMREAFDAPWTTVTIDLAAA